MAKTEDLTPPEPTGGDVAHLIAKAALSAVPIAGGPAAELFAALVIPPLERRRQEWMNEVAEALRRLADERRINLEALQNNEAFTSLLVQATVVATRNHHTQKRDALRNSVLNAALPSDLDTDIQLAFVRFVDELSPSHIRLLLLIRDEDALIAPLRTYGELYDLLAPRLAEAANQATFKMMCLDLQTRGLIWISADIGDFPGIYEASALLIEKTRMDLPRIVISDVGRQFLQFIGKT
jgi:hypothetical protein